MTTEFLSINDAASILGVNHHTVRREIARGNLKASRFGKSILIRRADLDKALKPVTRIGA